MLLLDAIPTPQRAGAKAETVRRLVDNVWPYAPRDPLVVVRDELEIVFDDRPRLVFGRDPHDPIGVDALVRVFSRGEELRVDPHRIAINPPLVHRGRFDPVAAYLDWLEGSIRGAPNPQGWRTRGTVTSVFSAVDGHVYSYDAAYANARNGTGSGAPESVPIPTEATVGQQLSGVYIVAHGFLGFDTSSIPDTDEISAVVLELYGVTEAGTFTIEVRDDGGGLDDHLWVAGDDLDNWDLVASLATASHSTGTYNSYVSEAAFAAAINKTGQTNLRLSSSRTRTGDAPTGDEFIQFRCREQSGTTQDPKLTITHAAPSVGARSLLGSSLAGLRRRLCT